jgi:adenine-specific DNA-methyltransferase
MKGFVPTPSQTVDLMVARLFEERPPLFGETILDPGCGNGAFIAGIIRWCRANARSVPQIVGIDSNPRLIEEAREKFKGSSSVEIREQDFLTGRIESQFNFIICNPPYVPITGLSETERKIYRKLYRTARGRFDLYLLFFERAARLLSPNGRLVFITPEKFLYVNTAQALREVLSQFQVHSIQLVDENTFGDLVTYPTITAVAKIPRSKSTSVVLRDGFRHQVSLPSGGESWWPAIHGKQNSATDDRDGLTLQNFSVRISCGVATGADEIFVRPTNELTDSLRPFAFPTISGRQLITDFESLPLPTQSLLVPYSRDGILLPACQLKGLRAYLENPIKKGRLLKRTCVESKPWYAFHENPPLTEILRPKILCKDIAPRARFWIDRKGRLVPRHSVYYIVPKNVEHLDALCNYLNCDAVGQWLSIHCQRAANGFLRLQSHVLKRIPVPKNLFHSTHAPGTLKITKIAAQA